MATTSEIYLNKKFVSKDNWAELIKTVTEYNGFMRSWKIIVTCENNQIRYYAETKCNLPATLNNMDDFLLKPASSIKLSSVVFPKYYWAKGSENIADIINYCEIKNKGSLSSFVIEFKSGILKENIKANAYMFLKKNGGIKAYKVLGTSASALLSVDFAGNKRYSYKGAPKYLDINKILHLLNSDSAASILKVDTFPYLQGDFYLSQNKFDFNKHSIIMGSSGCGKSKFISLMIHNIFKVPQLRNQYKVVIIDPHAALEDDIGGIARVVDFNTKEDSVDLFMNSHYDVVSSTELLIGLFKSLIADQYNSKIERVLRHSLYLLLTKETFNFTSLRKLLLDLDYRNNLVKELSSKVPSSVTNFFLSDFNEIRTKSYGEALSPIIGFIDEMEMLPVFNDEASDLNIKDTIKENFLTIFSLDRTKLGDKVIKTIAGLIMQQILTIIQRREINEHIIFMIDEVAVVENPILCRFLSEARKYNLSMVLAGQYFNQISNELKNSIFANVINYYIFRISQFDANVLVDNINMKVPLEDTREKKVKILSELNNRECIARVSSNGILMPAFKASTLFYESIPRVKTPPKEHIKQPTPAEQDNNQDDDFGFDIGPNVNLKDILLSTSSSKRK